MKRSVISNLAVLAGAIFAYQRLSVAVPIGKPSDPCPTGKERRLVGGKWICVLKFD